MAYFEENKLCIVTIVTCDVIDAPIDTETITESLFLLVFIWSKSDQWFTRYLFFESEICIL